MQNHFGLLDTDVKPIFMIIALDINITMRFSINCSAVICSPTVIHAILREATSETYGPRVYFTSYKFPIYNSSLLFILQSLLSNLYNKNTKNIYLIIFIRSHFCKWSWRDWQPLYRVGCKVLICLCRYEVVCVWPPTGLIPWFSKTKGNTYATLLHHPFLFKGKNNACSRGSRMLVIS